MHRVRASIVAPGPRQGLRVRDSRRGPTSPHPTRADHASRATVGRPRGRRPAPAQASPPVRPPQQRRRARRARGTRTACRSHHIDRPCSSPSVSEGACDRSAIAVAAVPGVRSPVHPADERLICVNVWCTAPAPESGVGAACPAHMPSAQGRQAATHTGRRQVGRPPRPGVPARRRRRRQAPR
jgi:hypothetical protein